MAEGVKAIIAKEKEMESNWQYPGSIEDMYSLLAESNSKSLLKKYLTQEVFENLKDKKTKLGGTLAHCINLGVVHLESRNGIRACDPEGYETFKDILDPIIKEYHMFKNSEINHPDPDFGNLEALPFGDVDPDGRYVVSTRVRVGRSADGIPFAPSISETQRAKVESKIMKAFESLQSDKEYQGTYYQLPKLTHQEADQLRMDHFLFSETDE
ncbi:arginine kinase-like [Tubulanus polymorphus]|uniref:arginine kinase-like n=1 Tax=Tubulanus polymorphus TaxID=672921 RepID=UPI003DA56763